MSFGTTIWNITEYATYICIIIQTALMLLGYATKGIDGANSDEGLNRILSNLSGVVNNLIDNPKRGSKPASQRRNK